MSTIVDNNSGNNHTLPQSIHNNNVNDFTQPTLDKLINDYKLNKQQTKLQYTKPTNIHKLLTSNINDPVYPKLDSVSLHMLNEYNNVIDQYKPIQSQLQQVRQTVHNYITNTLNNKKRKQSDTTNTQNNNVNNTQNTIQQSQDPNQQQIHATTATTDTFNVDRSTQISLMHERTKYNDTRMSILQSQRSKHTVEPTYHPQWQLYRVISGHTGWVRCVAVDHSNQWFATGSADRTIKLWDLASGQLKLTLTGHINTVRSICISQRHSYMFSGGEDHNIKCWDLETNQVIRNYHGHTAGVYTMSLHPTLDLLISGGRDSCARVWDIRSKYQVAVLNEHSHTVGAILCNSSEPQVITGSHDTRIKLWDLAKQRSIITLTHHNKSVRSLVSNMNEYTFISGAADNIKVWKTSDGTFVRNCLGHSAIINTLCINRDNVLVSGGDDGSMYLWDYNTSTCFQKIQHIPQPGSLEAESGIYQATFDVTGSRLITVNADKSINIYKEG